MIDSNLGPRDWAVVRQLLEDYTTAERVLMAELQVPEAEELIWVSTSVVNALSILGLTRKEFEATIRDE